MRALFAIVTISSFLDHCQLPHDGGGSDHGHGHGSAGSHAPQLDAGVTDDEDAGGPHGCVNLEGLYEDADCSQLAPGLRPYSPRFELFADGSTKQRFIYLPPEHAIDTKNPDRWNFPSGTRIYKTFSAQGKRLETRVFIKHDDAPGLTSWDYAAYVWNDDDKSVRAADAVVNETMVRGVPHVVPTKKECERCHGLKGVDMDSINGFGAIQLNHDDRVPDAWTLRRLLRADRLANGSGGDALHVSVENAVVPGSELDQKALGYLHGNCGHCHGGALAADGGAPAAGMRLWATVGTSSVSQSPAFMDAVCGPLARWHADVDGNPYQYRIVPNDPEHSAIIARMSSTQAKDQMPPIGRSTVDAAGVKLITAFIDSLDAKACEPLVTTTPTP